MNDIDRALNDYLDGSLSEVERVELFAWLREHPEDLRKLAIAGLLHRDLADYFGGMKALEASPEETTLDDSLGGAMILPALQEEEDAPQPSTGELGYTEWPKKIAEEQMEKAPRRRSRRLAWWVATAAVLVLIFLALPRGRGLSEARIASMADAQWREVDEPLKIGDRVPRGEVTLASGLTKLTFDNGTRIIVEGPARFAVESGVGIRLENGKISAIVSDQAKGFAIQTPQAVVRDMGTEFGVSAGEEGRTDVAVFQGKVSAGISGNGEPQVVAAGGGAAITEKEIRPVESLESTFVRAMPDEVVHLDVVDLMAGGDGLGTRENIGFDAARGTSGQLKAVQDRKGDYAFHGIGGVVDGCLIPDGSRGAMTVDSAGDTFTFPKTTRDSYGLIWAGGKVPWGRSPAIFTMLAGVDYAKAPHRLLVIHSNNAITLNLDAIRAMHTGAWGPAGEVGASLLTFHCRVGNSFVNGTPGENATDPRADICILLNGKQRYTRKGFTSRDGTVDIVCPLSAQDRYLTLATTDGGDGVIDDWVLWCDATIDARRSEPAATR
jgi:hypothetical protein